MPHATCTLSQPCHYNHSLQPSPFPPSPFPLAQLKSIPGATPTALLEAGFSQKVVNSSFSQAELEGKAASTPSPSKVSIFDVARDAKKARKDFQLPQKHAIKAPVSALRSDDPPPAVVIGSSGRVYASTSLWGLRPANEPRRTAIFICESGYFEALVLITIFANVRLHNHHPPIPPHFPLLSPSRSHLALTHLTHPHLIHPHLTHPHLTHPPYRSAPWRGSLH